MALPHSAAAGQGFGWWVISELLWKGSWKQCGSAPWPAGGPPAGLYGRSGMRCGSKRAAGGPPAGQGAYPTLRDPEYFRLTDYQSLRIRWGSAMRCRGADMDTKSA